MILAAYNLQTLKFFDIYSSNDNDDSLNHSSLIP